MLELLSVGKAELSELVPVEPVNGAPKLESVGISEPTTIVSGAISGEEVPEDAGVKNDCEGTALHVSVASSGISQNSSSSSNQTIVPPMGEPRPVSSIKSAMLKL